MRILSVVGARSGFMQLASVDRALVQRGEVEHVIVHTGRHHDPGMSATLFEELWIPQPSVTLGVGPGSHAAQTAAVMQRLEPVLERLRPDSVLVYGDVNSTLAAALVAAKLRLRVGHVEAGLRSGDWSMPEEMNRVVTDRLADLLFVPSRDAIDNLRAEGVPQDRIQFVGNVMIDSLCWALPRARELDPAARHGLAGQPYVVVTLHRSANADDPAALRELVDTLVDLSERLPVLFPVDPRTRQQLEGAGARGTGRGDLRLVEPLDYLEMLGLVAAAHLVITDSGGLQEETSYLGVPCLTLRPNTERRITCVHGTNRLVSVRRDVILAAAGSALQRRSPARPVIERWDGRAAERIARVLCGEERFTPIDQPVAPATRRRRQAMTLPRPVGVL